MISHVPNVKVASASTMVGINGKNAVRPVLFAVHSIPSDMRRKIDFDMCMTAGVERLARVPKTG